MLTTVLALTHLHDLITATCKKMLLPVAALLWYSWYLIFASVMSIKLAGRCQYGDDQV